MLTTAQTAAANKLWAQAARAAQPLAVQGCVAAVVLLAEVLCAAGKPQLAEQHLREFTAQHTCTAADQVTLLTLLGDALLQSRQWQPALAAYQSALSTLAEHTQQPAPYTQPHTDSTGSTHPLHPQRPTHQPPQQQLQPHSLQQQDPHSPCSICHSTHQHRQCHTQQLALKARCAAALYPQGGPHAEAAVHLLHCILQQQAGRTCPQALRLFAQVAADRQQPAAAAAAAVELLGLRPGDTGAAQLLAAAVQSPAGLQGLQSSLSKGSPAGPQLASALAYVAGVLLSAGAVRVSIQLYRQAVQADPASSRCALGLAQALEARHDYCGVLEAVLGFCRAHQKRRLLGVLALKDVAALLVSVQASTDQLRLGALDTYQLDAVVQQHMHPPPSQQQQQQQQQPSQLSAASPHTQPASTASTQPLESAQGQQLQGLLPSATAANPCSRCCSPPVPASTQPDCWLPTSGHGQRQHHHHHQQHQQHHYHQHQQPEHPEQQPPAFVLFVQQLQGPSDIGGCASAGGQVHEPDERTSKGPLNPEHFDLFALALLWTAAKVLFCGGALNAALQLLQLTSPAEAAAAQGVPLHQNVIRNEAAYGGLVRRLLLDAPVPRRPAGDVSSVLYVCGDSHILPLAWREVSISGQHHLLVPLLVTGCKAWHIRPGSTHHCGSAFWAALECIPHGGQLMMVLGEIDVREGLVMAVEKLKYATLEEAVAATVDAYVAAVTAVAVKLSGWVWVHCVVSVLQEARQVAKLFNTALRQQLHAAAAKGLQPRGRVQFIDIEAAVLQDQECVQLDGTHLHPHYLKHLQAALQG